MRVLLHQYAIAKRAGIAFIPVADDISRHSARRCSRPLQRDRVAGAPPTPQSRGLDFGDQSLRRPRCDDLRPVLPRILSCDNACQDHGLADRCDRNRGRVRRSANQLVGQVGASVRHRAVQHCRRGVAEANAANCLQRDGLILATGARGDAECLFNLLDVPATVGGEACGALADTDVPVTLRVRARSS
jgi:hypothetical protein